VVWSWVLGTDNLPLLDPSWKFKIFTKNRWYKYRFFGHWIYTIFSKKSLELKPILSNIVFELFLSNNLKKNQSSNQIPSRTEQFNIENLEFWKNWKIIAIFRHFPIIICKFSNDSTFAYVDYNLNLHKLQITAFL
jgi:hypothetical protein